MADREHFGNNYRKLPYEIKKKIVGSLNNTDLQNFATSLPENYNIAQDVFDDRKNIFIDTKTLYLKKLFPDANVYHIKPFVIGSKVDYVVDSYHYLANCLQYDRYCDLYNQKQTTKEKQDFLIDKYFKAATVGDNTVGQGGNICVAFSTPFFVEYYERDRNDIVKIYSVIHTIGFGSYMFLNTMLGDWRINARIYNMLEYPYIFIDGSTDSYANFYEMANMIFPRKDKEFYNIAQIHPNIDFIRGLIFEKDNEGNITKENFTISVIPGKFRNVF